MIRYVIVPDELAEPETYGRRISRLYARGGLVHTHGPVHNGTHTHTHAHSAGSHQVSSGQHVHACNAGLVNAQIDDIAKAAKALNVYIDVTAQGTAEAARKIAALADMVAIAVHGPELVIPASLVAQLGLPPGE